MDVFDCFMVIAAPIISISLDSSKENVGFHAPRGILFSTILAIILVILEVLIAPANPIVAPEDSFPTKQRPERHESLTPSSEFPLAPIIASLGIHSSSSSSSSNSSSDISSGSSLNSLSDSSLVHSLSQSHSGPSTRVASPRLWRGTYGDGTPDADIVADLGINKGVGAYTEDGIDFDVEVATSDIKEDEEEFEAKASEGGMMEIDMCSRCGGLFNDGNCQHCTNVIFEDEPVYDSNLDSYNETPNFSYPPSPPQTSSSNQLHCFRCGDSLEEGERCQRCTCKWCGYGLREGFCWFCASRDGNSFINAPNLNSFNDPPNVFTHPPQLQYESNSYYRNERVDIHYRRESTIPMNEIISQIPPSIVITPILPTKEPKDSLIMGDEDLNTIPKKESDEVIKSSVEDLVPIPSESEDTSESNSECDLPSCDDFSPINVSEGKFMTFSNPLFVSNDDFTSSDDESLSNEDVPEDNLKIYSNPFFEFDDEYISSEVNPLFNEVLEDIENKDSYDSNLDEPDLLVTPLSDANEDECFDPGDERLSFYFTVIHLLL
uniref:Uncharacterized protein n=1 Tax=Tanacetum cinerariifolium TaxID=118510 RepID=A0A6L2MNY3_TANCI|nr:hypothetical protein [Tanacetum cinerariifolium]